MPMSRRRCRLRGTMDELTSIRIDKWLWAARFFKTRSLAATAIDGGKVDVNGDRAKRSKELKVGDVVQVRIGPYVHEVTVQGLAARRGSAAVASELYVESAASVAARAARRDQLALLPSAFSPAAARPTKKDRRALKRFRGQ
jgi:ribosome-associated heat shock protein Hsp15